MPIKHVIDRHRLGHGPQHRRSSPTRPDDSLGGPRRSLTATRFRSDVPDPALRAWCHTHDVPHLMSVPSTRPWLTRAGGHSSRPGAGRGESSGVGTSLVCPG